MKNRQEAINTQTRVIHRGNFDHCYTADCFVNPESFDFHSSSWDNRNPQAWVITNGGYVVAIVFQEYYAYCDQDALDAAADSGKLDFLRIAESELADYESGKNSEGYPEYEGIINLGNASEPFDQQNLDYFTVPASLFSLDPVIIPVVDEYSRDEAQYMLQGLAHEAIGTDDVLDESGNVVLDAYRTLSHASEYLRSTL